MVCDRCKMAVRTELNKLDISPSSVSLGEIFIEQDISPEKKETLSAVLSEIGFEILNDSRSRSIEKIKTEIIQLIHHTDHPTHINYSRYIELKLNRNYNYLSNIFSETESITIETFIILQKIEKVKELLMYNQLSLTEIAYQMGYSSVAYLSGQFKKVTGLTPSQYKTIKENKRKSLDQYKP